MSKVIKTEVFKFEESTETARENIRDSFCENIDLDYEIEQLHEILVILGFYEPKIEYSGFYQQDSYCAFRSQVFSFERGFVKKIKTEYPNWIELHELAQSLFCVYSKSFYRLRGSIKTSNRGRCYADMHYNFDVFEDEINEWLSDFNHFAFKFLENSYEYYCSDDYIAELCEINNYYFDKNGNLV